MLRHCELGQVTPMSRGVGCVPMAVRTLATRALALGCSPACDRREEKSQIPCSAQLGSLRFGLTSYSQRRTTPSSENGKSTLVLFPSSLPMAVSFNLGALLMNVVNKPPV